MNTTKIKNDQAQYGMGYSNTFIDMLKMRKVETNAQFLIPYLKRGLKILDCGCGPGSMTIGFANYVKNGNAIGIDIEESQIEIAREDAKKSGVNNVTFQNASVLELPFKDNTFDIVFSQALLSHLKDPISALLEQKRVVKQGGMVAARNIYHSGIVFYPQSALLNEAARFHVQPVRDHGGDPDLGIKLGQLFRTADFNNVKHTVFCETGDITALARNFYVDETVNRAYSKKLLADGKITLEKLQAYQKAWLDFANDPNAFSYCPWGEVIGIK